MKSLFLFLTLTPVLAFSLPTIECETTDSGSKHHLLVVLNDATVKPNSSTYTRAQVELSNTKETSKGCIVFSLLHAEERVGHSVHYQADLHKVARIRLHERFYSEGNPKNVVRGELVFDHDKPSVSRVPLTCVKH